MNYYKDLNTQIVAAIAKAGEQQYNAIVYLLKAENHKRFKTLDRLTRYKHFLSEDTKRNIFNEL